jgi:hypothetical protein
VHHPLPSTYGSGSGCCKKLPRVLLGRRGSGLEVR